MKFYILKWNWFKYISSEESQKGFNAVFMMFHWEQKGANAVDFPTLKTYL